MSRDDWENFNVLTPSDADVEVKDVTEQGSSKTFKVNDYIPKKYSHYRLLRLAYIIGGVILVALTIIVITVICVKSTSSNDAFLVFDQLTNGSLQLILSDNKKLWTYNADSKDTTLFHEFKNVTGTFEIYGKNKIFWSESNTSKIIVHEKVIGQNSTNESAVVLLEEPRLKPEEMAYDYVGDNLYIVSQAAGSLVVINVKNKKHDIILTDLIRPCDIELDPEDGLMFILQHTDSILKGNMDGRSLKKIVVNSGISSMTLDRHSRRIYWVNDLVGIEASDYDGKDLESFPTDALNIVDLAIINDQLFWLWLQDHDVNATHHLLSCRINKGTCEGHVMQEIESLTDLGSIKVAQVDIFDLTIDSPCKVNNGGCQHICLLTPDSKHSCTCNLGWQLNPDKRTCREVKEFMLYALANFFRGRILDVSRNVSIDAIWPTAYIAEWSDAIAFDYDQHNDIVYFSDGKHIYSSKLKSHWSNQTTLLTESFSTYIKDIVYDWTTDNLYFFETHYSYYSIVVFNVKLGVEHRKTIIHHTCDSIYRSINSCKTATLAIYPSRGYLFYMILKSFADGLIYKTTTFGVQLLEIPDSIFVMDEFKLLTLDYVADRIYWTHNDYPVRIRHSNLDGSDVRNVTVHGVNDTRTIAVHRQWIYLSTRFSIWRVDKLTGGAALRVAPFLDDDANRRIAGVKIISDVVRPLNDDRHPCKTAGCEQLCFHGNVGAICACKDGESIENEKHCHVDPRESYHDYEHDEDS